MLFLELRSKTLEIPIPIPYTKPMQLTKAQIDEVLTLIKATLGPNLIGAYLYGSATLSGLKPQSDLDIMVVARHPITPTQRQKLVSSLLPMSEYPAVTRRPIELTIVVQSQVRPWKLPVTHDFMFGDWLRKPLEAGDLSVTQATENPDLAILLTMAMRSSQPLIGPGLTEVLDPIPPRDCLLAMTEGIDSLMSDLNGDERNVLLTLARIWQTVATGTFSSKASAAGWALQLLEPQYHSVMTHARAIYLGEEPEQWSDGLKPLVHLCADAMVRAIHDRMSLGTAEQYKSLKL